MKKRFVAGLLAVMLSFSMTVTSFAAEIPQGETGEQSVETEEDQTNTEEESKEDDSVIESSENQAGESNLDFAEKEVTAKADTEEETVSAYKVEAKAAVEDTSKWNAEDFTYEEMSKKLYGCDYSREFTVSGIAVSGFSESGLKKLETNKELVIPAEDVNGTKIMGVTAGAFKEKGLTSVKFPENAMVPYDDTVTHVVTERGNFIIGDSAFYKNNLTEVTLPEGVIAVLTSAFQGNQLQTVTLPKTIWWVENSSFKDNRISKLNFPKTCTFQCEIHANAFTNNNIKSVRLPDYTLVVQKWAFLYNPGIESVPDKAPSGEAEMGGVVYMYTDNPNLANMDRIHHIDRKSESQLSWHQKLIVGDKPEVDNVWQAADFTYDGTKVTGLSESGVKKSQNNKELILPDTVTEIGARAFEGYAFSKVMLPAKLKAIGEAAFKGNKLQTLSVPGTVKVISDSAFAQDEALLTELTLGEGIKEIQAGAFAGSALVKANLPDSLDILDNDAFKRELDQKVLLYTNVQKEYPASDYHTVKVNLGDWNEQDFTYNGTIVTGFTETGKLKSEDNSNLVIPDKNPDGDWITEIGSAEITDTDGLFGGEGVVFETLKLPSKLEKIGTGAFRGIGLQKVTFPETLEEIGMMAFQTNELREIILPDSVTTLGQAAFATNPKVERLVLSKNLKTIPSTAFGNTTGCAPYTELIIPEGVTQIENNAFNGNSLKKIEIPKSVTKIGSSAFMNTDTNRTLTEVKLHEGLTSIGSKAFGYAALTNVELPSTVTTLNKNTFYENANGKVTVYVDSMEQYEKFTKTESAYHLIKIKPGEWTTDDFTYDGTIVTGFSEKGLLKREDKKDLAIPDKNLDGDWITEIGSTEVADADGLFGGEGVVFETLKLPSKLEKIGIGAFRGIGLQKVTFPEALEEIGMMAFQTNELREIILPDSVTTLGQAAFATNPKVEKLVLSKNLKTIPSTAFGNPTGGCAPYTELIIPEGVTKIENNAFNGNSLTRIEIPETVTEIGSAAFMNTDENPTLKEIILHEGLEKIGRNAFAYASVKTIDLPSTVNAKSALDAKAFRYNTEGNVIVWVNTQEQIDILNYGLKNPTFELRNKNIFTYEVTEKGATVTGLEEGAVVGDVLIIPRTTPGGKVITEIADAAVGGLFVQNTRSTYKEVVLPSGLKRIGKFAFHNNGIEKVEFPEGLEEIAQAAFNTNNLTSVILPDSVVTLGANAFAANSNLSEVVLSKNLTEIPDRAFVTANLTNIEIPDGITKIGKYAFADNHFRNLVLSDSVKEIKSNAFSQTTMDMVLESVRLSKNLEAIGSRAFGNSNLSYVTIPSTLTELDKAAFAGAKKGSVYLYTSDEKQLEETKSFKPEGTGHKVVLEDMLKSGWSFEDFTYDGSTVTGWSEQGNITRKNNLNLVIPTVNPATGEAITTIGDSAFCIPEDEWDQGHTGVESVHGMETVVIPETVSKIGNNAFEYNNLETVDFPKGLVSIGENAFGSNKMKKVELPDSVTEMKAGAFSANNLTEIKLSKGLVKLENGVFSNNIRLTHVELPEGITEIGDFAFSGDRLETLTIPKSVTKIGRAAFKLHHLTELVIPGNVKEIGESAFEGTYKAITLKKLTIKEGVENIGKLAFRMGYLESVELPASVKMLANDAFKDNTGYQGKGTVKCYVTTPEQMEFESNNYQEIVFKANWTADCFTYAGTTITGFTDKGKAYLEYTKEVVLPDKNPSGEWITAIGAGAFKGYGLTKVTFPKYLVQIGEEAFADNNLTEVILPQSATDVADNAFDKGVWVKKETKPSDVQEENGKVVGTRAKDAAKKSANGAARTGDDTPVLPFGISAVLALAAIVTLLKKKAER